MDQSDEEIVKMVQTGQIERFGELVRRYEAKMSSYGRRFISQSEDIKDLVQDVFLKAYVNIKSFDTRRKFSSWIYRIAHNEFVNALKKKSWEKTFSFMNFDAILPHLPAKEEDLPDWEWEKEEAKQQLDRSLSRLEPKYREPVVLYYYEKLDYQEIADTLRLPVSTVGVRLRRARDKLKRIISAESPAGAAAAGGQSGKAKAIKAMKNKINNRPRH